MNAPNQLRNVTSAIDMLIAEAKKAGTAPHQSRQMRLFSTKEVCQLIGKSTTTIYNAEGAGIIQKPEMSNNGRRVGYTLEDINALREHFEIKPLPSSKERLGITGAIYNFKGGCGKTTTAVCLTQFLAIMGFKVLLIDMDSQASATSLFGYIPDEDISESETVLPYTLHSNENSLHYAIRETHIDGLSLIPANQMLSSSEFEAAAQIIKSGGNGRDYFQRLKWGIDTIKNEFDFVFVDAPPSLGIIGLQTLLSVDNLLIPCPPRMLDFVSTRAFLETATEYVETLAGDKEFKSIKVMISMWDKRNSKSHGFVDIMRAVLGDYLFDNPMLHSETFDDSTAVFQTPWESPKPDKRITENMKDLFNEVLRDLIKWNTSNV